MANRDYTIIVYKIIMLEYVYLIHFYRSAFMRTLRILALFFLCFWVYTNIKNGSTINMPLFSLSLFMQVEIFFMYKVARVLPPVSVQQNDGENLYLSCTSMVLERVITHQKTIQIIESLIKTSQGQFILQKLPADKKEVQLIEVQLQDLLTTAASLSKSAQGRFITTMDVMISYLILTESKTKLLFNKKLKQEELINILFWVRQMFKTEEYPQKKRVELYGNGIGESLTTGWTLETKKYTQDYSYIAYKQKPQIFGRDKEFALMIQAISKTENNNVLLVGDPGSGKENLVSLFASESYLHTRSKAVPHIKILELMVGPLIAGAANRSDLESRLQAIINEVSHSGNIILYIPEIQNIAGSSSYNIDLSGALLPYLKSGSIPIIASVSVGNYKSYIEKSPLIEAFTIVKLEEPDKQTSMIMLLRKAVEIEEKNHIILTYKAIEAAVEYADRYFQDSVLPGSAASVLEDVAHSVRMSTDKKSSKVYVLADDVINAIQAKTHIAITQPEGAEKDLLLHLEEKMHQRVIGQQDAIVAIAESMRRLRAGLVSLKRPISFLFLGPTGVGKTESAKALAELYFGGEDKMIRLDMSEYADEDGVKRLLGAPPGEGEERGELTDKIADHQFSLVLLDEFEKAHPKIIDLFLQVLEDGRLTDNKGKTVSFVNSIVIATSNAGAEFIREEIEKGTVVDKKFSHRLLDYLQSQHLFRPELINRFDDVVVFKPLGQAEMETIVKLMLADMAKRLQEQDIEYTNDNKLLEKIIKDGFDMEFGARPLRRYIQDNVEDIIAQKKLRDEIKRGSKVFMTVNDAGDITVTVTS
jgi:ATP-dependent Clp protease ATP-binding subunit ClpC